MNFHILLTSSGRIPNAGLLLPSCDGGRRRVTLRLNRHWVCVRKAILLKIGGTGVFLCSASGTVEKSEKVRCATFLHVAGEAIKGSKSRLSSRMTRKTTEPSRRSCFRTIMSQGKTYLLYDKSPENDPRSSESPLIRMLWILKSKAFKSKAKDCELGLLCLCDYWQPSETETVKRSRSEPRKN